MTATATRLLPVPVGQAWLLLVDARQHGRWIPLTRVSGDPPELGAQVTAVSGPGARRGAPGVVDRMRIDRFDPPGAGPGVAVFTKLGPVLRGSSRIDVAADGSAASAVTWTEDVHLVGPFPRVTAALLAPVLAAMLRLTLGRAERELRPPAQGSGRPRLS